jgi:hypothetical protein
MDEKTLKTLIEKKASLKSFVLKEVETNWFVLTIDNETLETQKGEPRRFKAQTGISFVKKLGVPKFSIEF